MNRKQMKEQAARYVKFVEWSDEDQCFIGRCPELFDGAVHGADEPKVFKELCEDLDGSGSVESLTEQLPKDSRWFSLAPMAISLSA